MTAEQAVKYEMKTKYVEPQMLLRWDEELMFAKMMDRVSMSFDREQTKSKCMSVQQTLSMFSKTDRSIC